MEYERMNYKTLMARGNKALDRGNEELAKALFTRAMDLANQEKVLGMKNSNPPNIPNNF